MRVHWTENRCGAMAGRWLIAAMLSLVFFAPGALAQPAKPAAVNGVYHGTYTGDQGPVNFKLALTQQDNGTLAGSFTLYVGDGADTKPYTCNIRGRYIAGNRMVQILRVKWETQPPAGVDMLGMNGTFDPAGGDGAGQIAGTLRARPAPKFTATRDADESAKYAAAMPAKDAAAAPAPAVAPAPTAAPPMRQPVAVRNGATRAPAAPAPSAPVATGPAAINGVYTGEVDRGNDKMKAKLSIKATDDGSLTALLTLDPAAHRGSSVTYKLTGKYVAKSHAYGLASSPYEFTTIEPVGSGAQDAPAASEASAVHIGITGPGTIYGSMTGTRPGSGEFHYAWISGTKDNAESADIDKAMLAQGSGTTTAVPVAPVGLASYAGVYNGTYTDKEGPVKFKLTVQTDRENKTTDGKFFNAVLTGVMVITLPEGSETKDYTCECAGFYIPPTASQPQRVQLTRRKWDTPPSARLLYMGGMVCVFDPNGGKLTGRMSDATGSPVEALRDAAESDSMSKTQLAGNQHPKFIGVYNGTFTRDGEPPTKFRLTILRPAGGLTGLATIYLPAGSGTKAYTYSLKGAETGNGKFELKVNDWETTPPANFKDFKGIGFSGAYVPDLAKNTARLTCVPETGALAEFFVPKFEATWDPTESADVKGAIAAQRTVDAAERAAAMKQHDLDVKNGQPKQLASNKLVRKSRAYWANYQTDMIREVFDGGFGAAMGDNEVFQETFVTYVDMFSAHCAEFLPPDHKKVTITMKTNRKADKYGNIISEDVKTFTVDMDSRFVDTYTKYHALLNSNDATMRRVTTAALPGGTERVIGGMMDIATDMQKFCTTNGGKSAMMRQMNENFLRAIHGDLSLQQSNGKIDGAQAESDKDVLPGKYARWVDGANAFFLERAAANPTKFGNSTAHDCALCQRLAVLYQFKMSPDEEYYYANDFGTRFYPIMGPRANCPDPEWAVLHPPIEQALGEIK